MVIHFVRNAVNLYLKSIGKIIKRMADCASSAKNKKENCVDTHQANMVVIIKLK